MSESITSADDLLKVEAVIPSKPGVNKLNGVDSDDAAVLQAEPAPQVRKQMGLSIKQVAIAAVSLIILFAGFMYYKKSHQTEQYSNPAAFLEGSTTHFQSVQDGAAGTYSDVAAESSDGSEFSETSAIAQKSDLIVEDTSTSEWVDSTVNVAQTDAPSQVPSAETLPTDQAATVSPPNAPDTAQMALRIEQLESSLYDLRMALASELGGKADASALEGFATKQSLMDSLAAIADLQSQGKRQVTAITKVRKQISNIEEAMTQRVGAPISAENQSAVINQSTDIQPVYGAVDRTSTTAAQPTASEPVVVQQVHQRKGARELAWSSFIENFGIAMIEGTTTLVQLEPGTNLLGRGTIKTISGTGCIVFTTGDKYAPTNGECAP